MSIRRFWPADRLLRLDTLKAKAKKNGLRLKATRQRPWSIPMFYLQFIDSDGKLAVGFFDIAEAEQWIAEFAP